MGRSNMNVLQHIPSAKKCVQAAYCSSIVGCVMPPHCTLLGVFLVVAGQAGGGCPVAGSRSPPRAVVSLDLLG